MNTHRGSLWRKWDLHIHTPASLKHWKGTKRYRDMTPNEKDDVSLKIIEALNDSDVDVFCIMDYWTFDGYFEIQSFLRRNPMITCRPRILPGVELRVEAPSKKRLNIHAILSDKLTQQEIRDFTSRLLLFGSNRPLSDEALREFARSLDKGKAKHYGFGNPNELDDDKLTELGFDTAEVTRESLETAINQLPKDSSLIMLAYDTHGGAEDLYWREHPPADNYFMRMADLFETRLQANIDLFLGNVTAENRSYIEDFLGTMGGVPKPAVSGSDAHSIENYGRFPDGKVTWIKADPSFEGLRQTLNSPSQRTFIGITPPQLARVAANKTKYISGLRIEQKSEDAEEVWFDNLSIEFNHGLVAIIGNKGMGKSALADILGLLGNSQRGVYFSFLSPNKFLGKDRSKGKAKNFLSKLQWESGFIEQKGLAEQASINSPELVRYVPQNFFEKICNETELKPGGEFAQELEKIIFSHVEDYKKQGCISLRELIDQQTKEIDRTIDNLKAELLKANRDIDDSENKLSKEYRQSILAEIKRKENELETLSANPPNAIPKPDTETDKSEQLDQIRAKKQDLTSELVETNTMLATCTQKQSAIERLNESTSGFERNYRNWLKNSTDDLEMLGIQPKELMSISFHFQVVIEQSKKALVSEESQLQQARKQKVEQLEVMTHQENQIRNGLKDSVQKYQYYQNELVEWEAAKQKVQGAIAELNERMKYLSEDLPGQLTKLQTDRQKMAVDIFLQKKKLTEVYKALYRPIQEVIDNHSLVESKYGLSFEVAIDINNDFIEDFFGLIKQNVSGSYHGREQGRRKLEEKIEGRQFEEDDTIISFLQDIVLSLATNEQSDPPTEVDLRSQLKKGSLSEFYDFLFGLDYLEPRYSLKLDGKELPQLSPGERGILLLIFYLLIDNDDCPLIIDQPEENLDNQSVFELLVPCVEEAKTRRQIFMVTHNPNLAVVCDADQIIHAQIDKQNGNRVIYSTGSIENLQINKTVVDILEGTWLAFRKRESMYQIGV